MRGSPIITHEDSDAQPSCIGPPCRKGAAQLVRGPIGRLSMSFDGLRLTSLIVISISCNKKRQGFVFLRKNYLDELILYTWWNAKGPSHHVRQSASSGSREAAMVIRRGASWLGQSCHERQLRPNYPRGLSVLTPRSNN